MKKFFTSGFHWIYIFKEDIIASLTEKTLVAQALRLSYFTSIQPEKWKFSDSIKNDEKPWPGDELSWLSTWFNSVEHSWSTQKHLKGLNLVENPNSEISKAFFSNWKNRIGPQWTAVDRGGPRWTAMDRSGPQWTAVDRSGPQWTAVDRGGPRWTAMDRGGPQWTAMDRSGPQS